ncbi:unnamed protein product [Rhodiola kirilowii]
MDRLNEELVLVTMQFLNEANLSALTQLLKDESAVLFNKDYFRENVSKGEWEVAEKYLTIFTNQKDNEESSELFFMLKKQRCLEALARDDIDKAIEILNNELDEFKNEHSHKRALKKLKKIWKMENFRDHKMVSEFGDTKASRTKLLEVLERLMTVNPKFHQKLEFPNIEKSRLLTIIKQSLDWQHMQCKNPRSDLEIRSLFEDHKCDQPVETQAQPSVPTLSTGIILNADSSLVQWQPAQASLPNLMPSQNPAHCPLVPAGSSRRRPVTSGKQNPSSKRYSKRRVEEEVPQQNVGLMDGLPLTVVMSMNHDSTVTSMDFNPKHQWLLLAGTDTSNVYIWDVSSKQIIFQESFEIWDIEFCPKSLKSCMSGHAGPAVTRVKWSPDGIHFAIAYEKCLVHVYSYKDNRAPKKHGEIEVGKGRVFDVAFTNHNNEPWIITCGEDKIIKVWNFIRVQLVCQFEGHKHSVCSLCLQQFKGHQAIFSADVDGNIKIWLYNNRECLSTISTPKRVMANISCSIDGSRMFIGGTNEKGDSFIAELYLNDSSIKREYKGLVKPSVSFVQYDIAKGKYLAAVDGNMVKFWDMDHSDLMTMTDAGGGIGRHGSIKFNRDGTLLAVPTHENAISILANAVVHSNHAMAAVAVQEPNVSVGNTLLEASVPRPSASRSPMAMNNNGNGRRTNEPVSLPKPWSFKEINDVFECSSIRIYNEFSGNSSIQVSWLAYTSLGRGIMVLGSNGKHKYWVWQDAVKKVNVKATTSFYPKLRQAPDNSQMVNDIGGSPHPQGRVSCFAFSKDEGYFLSTSGGMISIYDISNFKTLGKLMTPPPAATSLAIHPEGSKAFIFGMEDSSIQIYDCQTRQVVLTLTGHSKRVTGLAFSEFLNVLVSSGADLQLCAWSIDKWEKVGNTFLEVSTERASDIRVEFHKDQMRLMAVHKSQIAIYRAPQLALIKRWVPQDASSITHAAYSCDGESIFVAFENGNVQILTSSTLELKCIIKPASYIPPVRSHTAFPVVVAAHPLDPNQFALGLSDGVVAVLEPLEEDGMWGMPRVESQSGPSASPGVHRLLEPSQRMGGRRRGRRMV